MSLAHKTEDLAMLPLDAWHRARGGRMVPFAGHAMPVQYDGIIAEHLWTRENAGLFDVSHMGQLLVASNADDNAAARAALETLLPADLSTLAVPGMVCALATKSWPLRMLVLKNS